MGQTLSEPITETKSTTVGGGKEEDIVAASSCMQGWRITMEDAHVLLLHASDDETASFFGVYDGHGGSSLAQHVSKTLHKKILNHKDYKDGSIKEALVKSHLELDYEMSYDHRLREDSSGTTAVSVLVKDGRLYCANIGDSRALACVGGQVVELSHDHKPSDPLESARIRSAGGYIEFNRVNGNLALSRAFGDFIYKKNVNKPPEQQMVTAYPDVISHEVKEDLEFLIIACDGIWDVMTNHEVVRFVRARIAQGMAPQQICEELLYTCLAPDCRMGGLGCDNMTAVLVCFLHGKNYLNLSAKCSHPGTAVNSIPSQL